MQDPVNPRVKAKYYVKICFLTSVISTTSCFLMKITFEVMYVRIALRSLTNKTSGLNGIHQLEYHKLSGD